jgi:hypothetical protein
MARFQHGGAALTNEELAQLLPLTETDFNAMLEEVDLLERRRGTIIFHIDMARVSTRATNDDAAKVIGPPFASSPPLEVI